MRRPNRAQARNVEASVDAGAKPPASTGGVERGQRPVPTSRCGARFIPRAREEQNDIQQFFLSKSG